MNKILSAKTILITGGTSRLGEAFVHNALREGAGVFFTYLNQEEKAQRLNSLGAEGFRLDLSDSQAIEIFARNFKARVKKLDVLIHNAAAVRDHTLSNMTEEEWDYVLNVDLKAPYYLTKKLLPLLFPKRSASQDEEHAETRKIFMITSRVAIQGGFGVSNYAAAKAGLIGLAKSLAQELGRKNILVNAVNPGFMKSAMTESLPGDVIRRNLDASAIGRFSDPEEVADFLVYLCSDQMTQVTGQVIHFDSRKI